MWCVCGYLLVCVCVCLCGCCEYDRCVRVCVYGYVCVVYMGVCVREGVYLCVFACAFASLLTWCMRVCGCAFDFFFACLTLCVCVCVCVVIVAFVYVCVLA